MSTVEPKPRAFPTRYGFTFGAAIVERTAAMEDGRVCVTVKTEAGEAIEIYVSPKGRSIRVFENGKELKA